MGYDTTAPLEEMLNLIQFLLLTKLENNITYMLHGSFSILND